MRRNCSCWHVQTTEEAVLAQQPEAVVLPKGTGGSGGGLCAFGQHCSSAASNGTGPMIVVTHQMMWQSRHHGKGTVPQPLLIKYTQLTTREL